MIRIARDREGIDAASLRIEYIAPKSARNRKNRGPWSSGMFLTANATQSLIGEEDNRVADIAGALDGQADYRLFRRDYAEGKAPLVIVCGSGLSAPANIPTWSKLRKTLQAEAENKAQTLNQMGEAFLNLKVASLQKQDNPWIAFKVLKEVLSKPTFERLIEEELTPGPESETPAGYTSLLKLCPRGIVTLNLDKFTGEALASANPGKQITPVYGKELAQKWYTLEDASIYLLYLHGVLGDPSTWVMTQDDLADLVSGEGHAHFLKKLYTDNLVLFVGISADDVALSGRLLELTRGGFRPRNLYWLTTRVDPDTERWASDAYISLIRYPGSTNKDHQTAIEKLVADCISFRPTDDPEPPLISASSALDKQVPVEQIDPMELAQQDPETVRYTLAITLNDTLKAAEDDEEEKFRLYREFCDTYDYALNRAFYRSKLEQFRTWFDYKLEFPFLGKGNFGEVYSAISPTGELVAVKIMHLSIFGNDDMLGGFRRGVRSMQFITNERVPGMVPMLETFELPPTIVMPFVVGSSLEDALRDCPSMPWLTRLDIALCTALIIKSGHSLPQTVLHRDVKPSNIMVTNLVYDGAFDPEIVVLDFDMSWHKGSKERDIQFESRDDFGYLAPEQTDPSSKYTARNTKVDSYGLGMTIYYMFGHKPPMPNEGLSSDWFERALRSTRKGYTETWASAPARLARLICRATEIDQGRRVDFASLARELENLKVAVADPENLHSADLWAEEVLASVLVGMHYSWNDATESGTVFMPSGIGASVKGNHRQESVEFEIGYSDRGMRERSALAKYLGPAVENSERILKSGGWKILDRRHSAAEASVRSSISLGALKGSTRQAALATASKALAEFDFQ
jgi:eukaryotic-like serine/threonine-protein kinase